MMRAACLCTLLALLSPVLYAAPVTYAITPDKTSIGLSWRAFGHQFSQARLQGVSGTVTLNPDEDRDDRIEVTIPVGTLVASNSLLTWQLKSNLFLMQSITQTFTLSVVAWPHWVAAIIVFLVC